MRITTKGRYALRAMANLAASYQGKPRPIKIIAAEESISPEFLEQIFFKLKKAGIIGSVRGPGGGFVLDKQPDEITVKDIFVAVDEGLDLTPCTACTAADGEDPCDRMDHCIVYSVWQEASDHIINYFDSITLQSILDKNHARVQQLLAGNDVSA
jgi:Rrf2 family transcriptional regulator, iron-sulfur cluster assembly transcription factor